MKPILVIQNMWDDPVGIIGELLDAHHVPYRVLDVEQEDIPSPEDYGAVIILGGAQNANEEQKYPYLAREKECIRVTVQREIPFLGICLGGQLLASALGAQVRRHTHTEIGFSDVRLTPQGQHDPLFANFEGLQSVYQWHEDTFALPQQAVLLATNEQTENQAFRVGRNAYGLQYHIELTTAMLDTWLHDPALRQEVIKAIGQDAYEQLDSTSGAHYSRYYEHTRTLIENFLKIVRFAVPK